MALTTGSWSRRSVTPFCAAQEIQLAHRVQKWLLIQRSLEEEKREPEAAEKRAILLGKRAYNRFFNCNLRILGKLANKWQIAATHLSREDLVQEGSIGLSRAILKFDPPLATSSPLTPGGGSIRLSVEP